MKNLKKVLLALVVVAMLVSSVVTIAIANESEPEYTGSVEEAQKLYDAVLAEEIINDLAKQSTALVAFYAYIDANPIDPAEEGYAALIEAYNLTTYTVGDGLYSKYLESKSTDSLKAVFTHVASAPSLDDTVAIGDVEYADFVKAVNFASVKYADELVDALFATVTSGEASYYEYLAAQQAITKFFDEVKSLSYEEVNPNADVYTGNILALQALMRKVKTGAKLDELQSGLAEVYAYLRANPVNPVSDGFAAFIVTYNERCEELIDTFADELNGATTVAEQVALLKNMSAYLTANSLSENVIEAFNDKLADVTDEYNNFSDNFEGGEKLAAELADIAVVVPGEDLTELTALITALENVKEKADDDDNAGVGGGAPAQDGGSDEPEQPYIIRKASALAAVYDYLAENEINPATEGYAELIVKYNAEKELVLDLFVKGITEPTNVGEKINGLMLYGSFLDSFPLTEAAIDKYNALRVEVAELLDNFSKALKKLVLPTYTPAEAPIITTNVEMLNFMLSHITGELETKKVAMSAMYTYLLSVKIDTEEEGYDAFVEGLNAKRAELTSELFKTIDDAETPEAELKAFQDVKAYLDKTPYSYNAVIAFNNKVAETYTGDEGEATRESLTIGNEYIYFAVAEALDFFNFDMEEEPAIDDIFAAIETVYAYSLRNYDVTEDPYYIVDSLTFNEAFDQVFDMMGKGLVYYAEDGAINTDIEKVSLVCEFFKKVPFSEAAINKFNDMIDREDDPATTNDDESGLIQQFAYASDMVEETFPVLTYIYNDLNALIAEFNKTEGLDNRMEAFKAIYELKADVEDTILTSVQAGDAAFREAYADVCDKMAAEIVATVIADTASAPSVQLASFNKAFDFLSVYEFSQTAVNEYNAKLETVQDIDFVAVANSILTECPALEYESPEGTESDFTTLKGYIDAAANSDTEFVAAYKYFGGDYKKSKPVDFAKADFAALVETFTAAKSAVTQRYTDAIDAAELDDKPAMLEAMRKFVNKNMVSSAMVEAYAKKCDDVGSAFTEVFNAAFNPYADAIADIHKLLADCVADTSIFTEAELAVYDDMQLKLDALEYAEVYGQILGFKTATGDDKYAFLIQNQKVDAITAYLKTYEVSGNYNEYAFANALFAQAAEDFVKLYADIVDMTAGENEDIKAQMVAPFKTYIEENMYCKVMADLFNAYFAAGEDDEKIEYNGEEYVPNDATGTLDEYSALMKSYMGVALQNIGTAGEPNYDYETYFEAKLEALEAIFAYLEDNPFDATSLLTALDEAVAAAKAELAALTELQKQKAEAETPESEYDFKDVTIMDFENGSVPYLENRTDVKQQSIVTETLPDGSTNKYWLVETVDSGPYFDSEVLSTTVGTVYEFDVMLPLGVDPMRVDFRPVGTAPNVSGTAYLFNFFTGGVFTKFDAYDPTHPAGVEVKLSQGEWTHVIVVLNPVEYTVTLYVDYVQIGKIPLVHEGSENNLNATNLRFALATANSAIAFDNIKSYVGTSYRTFGKFDGMSDEDKFKYYVDFFSEPTYEPVSRIIAYNKAATMVESYRGVAGFEDYVTDFDVFDVDSVIPPEEKRAKLDQLVQMMNESGADAITTETYKTVSQKIVEIEAFMANNPYYLDQASYDYNDVKFKVANSYTEIARVEQLIELIDALKLFANAKTVTGMTKRAAAVEAEYEKCNFRDVDNYVKASNDPAIIAFLEAAGTDITLENYYTQVMAQRIADRTTYENSGKIVSSVNKLKAMVENASELSDAEFFDALMAAAKENFDYTNAYMTVIRNIIKSENYDKSYVGLDEAIEVFNHLDVYFYQLVVEAQCKVIREQLDRYPLTTSYIDKLGVCTYVRKYIDENSVDVKDPDIAPYFTMLLAFEEELKSYEAEYESILQSNTAAFIALVERMSAFVEYKDIKPLYDEALNNYFYNMNQDSDAAKAAMATFDAYAAIVKATEESSKLFVAAAEKLSKATKTKDIYRALVECAAYVDGVDSSIDGVANALTVYNAKLAAYNAKINPVNTQIEDTSDVVCSVRTVSVDATVLATIKKIINK